MGMVDGPFGRGVGDMDEIKNPLDNLQINEVDEK